MPNISARLVSALEALPDDVAADEDRISVSWPIAAYTEGPGSITIRHALLDRTVCVDNRLLDVGGLSATNPEGVRELSLNAFHCLDSAPTAGGNTLDYRQPVNVVATVRGVRPALLTVQTRIGPGEDDRPRDVFLTVSSWDTDGEPLGRVPFAWRCLVPTSVRIG